MTSAQDSNPWIQAREVLESIYLRRGYKFRGHANAEWKLQPSLGRECAKLDPAQLLSVELAYSMDFARAGHLHLPTLSVPPSPDTDNRSILGWWVYMQHYGVPTRLLDWTSSPYVAAYFAACEEWAVDGAVWYFNQSALNQRMSTEFSQVDWRKPPLNEKVFAFYPQRPTDRILAQKGTFTVSASGIACHEPGLQEFDLDKVIIPAVAKPYVLQSLLAMNVSANVLFPGLDGMGRELKTRLKVQLAEL